MNLIIPIVQFLLYFPLTCSFSIVSPEKIPKNYPKDRTEPDGDWEGTKNTLQNPNCCVVSVPGLENHLRILQTYFTSDQAPSDLDLRARVHNSNVYDDCRSIRNSVLPLNESVLHDPCTNALVELAKGVSTLGDNTWCKDVFIRIVCASNYQALDPMYHTDKSPLRGYVTLAGVGTEYMTRTCSPIEYTTLRGLGNIGYLSQNIKQANELEFIVMKGDEYVHTQDTIIDSVFNKVWKRRYACVHRSPPAGNGGRRRVIVSLDLADGDDREWYQVGMKREWRCGMTQRKSRLVA